MKKHFIDFSFKLLIGLCIYFFIKVEVNDFKVELRKSYDIPDTSYILQRGYTDTVLFKKSVPQILK